LSVADGHSESQEAAMMLTKATGTATRNARHIRENKRKIDMRSISLS
jgi:hypothetical protein